MLKSLWFLLVDLFADKCKVGIGETLLCHSIESALSCVVAFDNYRLHFGGSSPQTTHDWLDILNTWSEVRHSDRVLCATYAMRANRFYSFAVRRNKWVVR